MATARKAESALRICSEAGGRGVEGRGSPEETGHWLLVEGWSRASLRPPGIGWWGGQGHVVRNRRGKRALCGPSFPGGRRRPGTARHRPGGAGVPVVCEKVWGPGHPGGSGGGREVPDP